mmetsp:Transcript_5260/g.15255  ORF Transcript_5260/g.15255 Transcript_5260/m.15255 type:complete len:260 (-) Transcript_5260:271-1050(-)
MLNLYPSGYHHDDFDPFYSDPRLRRQLVRRAQLQQQAAMEEEQRRAQQMRYERVMREEQIRREEVRRRYILEQRKRNLEHQRRREEVVRRQALLERQWQQQRQGELELEQRQLELKRIEHEEKKRRQEILRHDTEYGIVHGPDGRLYKLHSDEMHGYDGSFGGVNPMNRGRSQKLLRPMVPPLIQPLNDDETYPITSTSEESALDEEESYIAPTKRRTNVSANMVVISDTVKEPNAIIIVKRRTNSAGKKSKPTKKTAA